MLPRPPLLIGSAFAAAAFGLTTLLQWGGVFDRVEHAVVEYRSAALQRTVDSDIVIVGIDARSLETFGEWPWPRSFHARLLQHLDRASPAQVFFDIDFSSASLDPRDDGLLERALAEWDGPPVLLAAHNQADQGSSGSIIARRPLEPFRRYAREASVILEPDSDGLVREIRTTASIDNEIVSSAFAADRNLAADTAVRIDFSIDPASFGYVSYSDLLNGEIDPAEFDGKRVFIGATSFELGDAVPVPRYRSLPGVVVQALASATAAVGPASLPPFWLYALILASWTALWFVAFTRGSWRKNSVTGLTGMVLLFATALFLYGRVRIELEVVPLVFVLLTAFVVAALRSLDAQTLRAIAYAVGVRRRDALLKSLIETSMDSIICLDSEGIIRTANPAAATLFACPLPRLLGAPITTFIPDFGPPQARAAQTGPAREYLAVNANQHSFPVEATVSRVAVDDRQLFTTIVRDVTERKAQQDQLEHQATHDPLTELPNRTAVSRYLSRLLAAVDEDQRIAVLLLDLCRFKEVNDTLGHEVGDEVLKVVSERFRSTVANDGFIGRIGGDEFVVIVPDVSARLTVEQLTQNLVDSLKRPIQVRGIGIEVGLSVGIAFYPDHGGNAVEVLRHADVAMYSAKRRNRSFEFYSRDDDLNSVRRLSMVSDLRSAITLSEIDLVFQPQVDLQDGRLVGAEALLRWNHPVHGAVSPTEFIAIAEATDIIQPLTEWTIDAALRQFVTWEQVGLPVRVAVNLSARSLQDTEFPQYLEQMLRRFGIAGRWLELEITETAMMLDPQRALEIVRDLQALGVRIAIDDFGTGYSSLGYLRDLRASALKLDKSFVTELETQKQNRVIVESTAQMASALGLEMVAEGVETQWVSEYLTGVGYSIGQGYWFGKPMSADQLFAKFPADRERPKTVMQGHGG